MPDVLLAAVIVLMGGAGLMAFFSRSFKTPGFQAYFFVLSVLLFLGGLVTIINAPNMGYERLQSDIGYASDSRLENHTEVETIRYVLPTATSGIFGGFLITLLWALVFIIITVMIYFIIDTVMMMKVNRKMQSKVE